MSTAEKPIDPACAHAHRACIGLGANLGDALRIIRQAWLELSSQQGVSPLLLSSPYRSAPLDMNSSHWFCNAVGLLATRLSPMALLRRLQQLEAAHGRVRDPQAQGYTDRSLDLDLLSYDALLSTSPELILPHPRLRQRLFVLAPLAEILPQWRHPLGGANAATLAADLEAAGVQQVRRICWPCGEAMQQPPHRA